MRSAILTLNWRYKPGPALAPPLNFASCFRTYVPIVYLFHRYCLTYLPINDRETALSDIDKALLRISARVEKAIPDVLVFSKRDRDFNLVASLLIRRGDATIKVEPNPVLRGSVFPTETRVLCHKARDLFELSLEARTLSFEDLYGGKVCAALDRQHPRDLFVTLAYRWYPPSPVTSGGELASCFRTYVPSLHPDKGRHPLEDRPVTRHQAGLAK